MKLEDIGAIHADERRHIAQLLARYPALRTEEVDELRNWFDRVATPLDIGHLASDPAIAEPYRRFRADHIDRLRPIDKVKGIALLAIAVALASIFLLHAP